MWVGVLGDGEILVETNSHLTFGARIMNDGEVFDKTGPGRLELTGNINQADVRVLDGTLRVTGTQGNSSVLVTNTALLEGCGVAGLVTAGSGSVCPGASPGRFTVAYNLTLGSNATVGVELNGTGVGTDYDQLKVNGSVNLGLAALRASLGFVPALGDTFVIIDNDGADSIYGTFAGLPEGAQLVSSGTPLVFRITYAGGDGNDVALTHVPLPPEIVRQPEDQVVLVGGTAEFRVEAAGALPLGYQWRKDGVGLVGQTQSTLTLGDVQLVDAGYYSVVVSNAGGAITSSPPARLTVLTPPSIVVTPASCYFGVVALGSYAERTFVVTNRGAAALSNGVATVDTPFTIMAGGVFNLPGYGSTNVVVRFTPSAAGSSSNRVRFTTANGGNVTNAVAGEGALVPVANFTANPTSGQAPLAVVFTDTSSGTITNRYWDFGDGTATNATMTLFMHVYGKPGTNTVTLMVSGPLGASTNRRIASVVVTNLPPVITVQPRARTNVVGSSLMFSVTATGTPPLTLQWREDTHPISAATNRTFVLVGLQPSDAGAYNVTVSNGGGVAVSSNAMLQVRPRVLPGVLAGPVANAANGLLYWLLGQSTWVEAEAAAQALGGHLATLRSAAEQDWVYTNFSYWGGVSRHLSIGLYDADPYRNATNLESRLAEFVWASGEPVSYTHWRAGEPNNWLELGEFWVHIIGPDYPAGATYWNDVWDTAANQYVVTSPLHGVAEVVPLCLGGLSVSNGTFRLVVNGPVGSNYVIQVSSNLVNWLPLVTNQIPAGGFVLVPDPVSGWAKRFYRALRVE